MIYTTRGDDIAHDRSRTCRRVGRPCHGRSGPGDHRRFRHRQCRSGPTSSSSSHARTQNSFRRRARPSSSPLTPRKCPARFPRFASNVLPSPWHARSICSFPRSARTRRSLRWQRSDATSNLPTAWGLVRTSRSVTAPASGRERRSTRTRRSGLGVVIGAGCTIHAGVRIYHDTVVGDRVILHSGAVIGADGFGFVSEPIAGATDPDEPTRHRKRRQLGRVVIEDDVEVGANSTIDRASLSETRIARGTKIDNLVMIGHNCTVGRHCILISQVGVSGSTTLGDYVVVGRSGRPDRTRDHRPWRRSRRAGGGDERRPARTGGARFAGGRRAPREEGADVAGQPFRSSRRSWRRTRTD